MKKYRLYLGLTQNNGVKINRGTVITWLTVKLKQFEIKGATIESVLGYWEGSTEETLVLNVLSDTDIASFFRNTALIYKHDFKQDCVLFEVQDVSSVSFI